jgi:hypothetical protein
MIDKIDNQCNQATSLLQPTKQCNTIHRGKKIKPVYCGDYEFLTRSYGLSGASGKNRNCTHSSLH